ncbi:hypothetical protein RLOC_00000020 [Lonchura striata]|uniref:Uncharacterized protein n=1 Tax=Lonchura striata TaxID=40157 RepID=A0A218UP36_9PASE|nr:hypothetical protein RLOC_00000020 [Lonchura striata domestica]
MTASFIIRAAYQMCLSVIFFDEIDALAPLRSNKQDQIHRQEKKFSKFLHKTGSQSHWTTYLKSWLKNALDTVVRILKPYVPKLVSVLCGIAILSYMKADRDCR